MKHRLIARIMCDLTDELLWKPRIEWARKHNQTADLKLRVGDGKRTCVSHRKKSDKDCRMTLTIGALMVESKANPMEMCMWRTSVELHEKGYYGGELNLLNALAHCIIHEFGHVVQVVLGRRYESSVHNHEFYAILDRIHASPVAGQLRDELSRRCLDIGVDLQANSVNKTTVSAILDGKAAEGILTMGSIRVGQRLFFRDPKLSDVGQVVVKEKRRTRVLVEQVARPNQRWLAKPHGLVDKESRP